MPQEEGIEVFITEVKPDQVEAFKAWTTKMSQMESQFPGFKGVFVKEPQGNNKNWITFLRFDTQAHLNGWLASPERKEILKDSERYVRSLEDHALSSPYSGWFCSFIEQGGASSPWKQAMLVLLVLYPIVILEIKFLNPFLWGFNPALATFIGNALSVALITWPCLPFALKGLGWWLTHTSRFLHYVGGAVVVALYVLEIFLFWNFLVP